MWRGGHGVCAGDIAPKTLALCLQRSAKEEYTVKVLVVGSGGREHALVWKLAQSPHITQLYCAPGNAGSRQQASNIPIAADDIAG